MPFTPEQDDSFVKDLNDDAELQKAKAFEFDPSRPLWPPRRELFAQLVFGGYPPTYSYEQAGYVRDTGNASRLLNAPEVRDRIEWLMQSQSDRNQRQMARVVAQKAYSEVIALEEAEMVRARAMYIDKLHTALQATALKCRVMGLLHTDEDGRSDRALSDMTLEELEKSVAGLDGQLAELDREIRRKQFGGPSAPGGTPEPNPGGKVH